MTYMFEHICGDFCQPDEDIFGTSIGECFDPFDAVTLTTAILWEERVDERLWISFIKKGAKEVA